MERQQKGPDFVRRRTDARESAPEGQPKIARRFSAGAKNKR